MPSEREIAKHVLGAVRVNAFRRGKQCTIFANPREDGRIYMKICGEPVTLNKADALRLVVAIANAVYTASNKDVLEWAWAQVNPRKREEKRKTSEERDEFDVDLL